ncbi:MAG: heme exporter protein CcmB [Flavobacteriales bacterium]|nr:heme exporter protein CcmB [Flavobacteriales bacterium]MCX7768614.1 heme exporter protein CcmB [Flavobacteriales bacterium]MDW8409733.1 heme exporter protein CcmB [Flavobacteriales bacterium]
MISVLRRIATLASHDLQSLWRTGSNIGALVVYVLSTIFLFYRVFLSVSQPRLWTSLLWLTLLFSSAFVASGLFRHLLGSGRTYYFFLARPSELFLSKALTAFAMQSLVFILNVVGFAVFLGFPVASAWWFLLALWLSALAVASVFILSTAVASKADAGGGLTAVLGFPLMVPTLTVSLQATGLASDGIIGPAFFKHLALLVGLCILPLLLGAGLFSYLWRD